MQERQSQQDYFLSILTTVVGQAFQAAGYFLEESPMQWVGGRYRYVKQLDESFRAYIEFQVLIYASNEWVSGQASRFQVTLIRSDQPGGRPGAHPRYAKRSLPELVVEDFGVAILPSAAHWWSFDNVDSLGHSLAEAGHLAIGYGMPWLSGELLPPQRET